tara:strand:- start:22 stop:291 length:270 start_codon:yes stop_codon:yes gene_type:complete
MSEFENKCCKILSVVLLLLVISMWLQLSGCSSCESQVPPPPSDYIDEVNTSNLVYIKYIPDWYVVPDKLEDRLILPIHFIDEIDMSNYA